MRIALVAPRYPPDVGGIETHVKALAEGLVAKGDDVEVFTTAQDPTEEYRNGVLVRRFRRFAPNHSLYHSRTLRTALKGASGRFDVVHCHGYNSLTTAAAIQASPPRTQLVLTLHSAQPDSWATKILHFPYQRWFGSKVGRFAAVVCVSEFERAAFEELYPKARNFHVIPNGLSNDVFRRSWKRPTTPLVLSVGRLERYKRHDCVISAMADVRHEFPLATLLIVGRGPDERRLTKLAAATPSAGKVTITGGLTRTELLDRFCEASVICIVSEYESQSILAHEAIALGTPLVLADNSALHEIVRTCPAAAVSEPISAKALGERIRDALRDPSAHQSDKQPLTLAQMVDRVRGLYAPPHEGGP